MKFLYSIVLSLVFSLLPKYEGYASNRVALVIGNSQYEHVSALPNPVNDADDISAALSKIGFSVMTAKNLDYTKMRLVLREFSEKSRGSDIALVYYAGHGIEVDRQNYLIPTDAKLSADTDVEFEAMPLESVSRAVAGAKGLRLILLDACRDNPFAKSMTRTLSTRSIGQGLARIEPSVGTLVGYAAKEGTVAADGEGRNSPYTAAFLRHLREPGLEIQFMFRKIRDSVIQSTKGLQEPFTYGSLPGKQIFLNPQVPTIGEKSSSQQPTRDHERTADIEFWRSVSDSKDIELYKAYLDKFPKGTFVDIAKFRIKELGISKPIASDTDAVLSTSPKPIVTALLAQLIAHEKKWPELSKSHNINALREYAKLFPESETSKNAQRRIEILSNSTAKFSTESSVDSVEKPSADLIKSIQSQLNRVGCDAGNPDGIWGNGSKAALSRFKTHSGSRVASLEPTNTIFQLIRSKRDRICPLICNSGFESNGDQCVKVQRVRNHTYTFHKQATIVGQGIDASSALGRLPGRSLDNCKQACSEMQSCEGFVHIDSPGLIGICSFFTDITTLGSSVSHDTFMKQ